MEQKTENLGASLVIRSLKRFRDRYLYNTSQLECDSSHSPKTAEDAPLLDRLPDICRLGATSRHWRAMLEERVEGEDQDHVARHDYMAEYLKGHPACRQKWPFPRPPYEVVTSFLHSLLPSSEPRYAMFGPGIEQLDVSMVTRLMHAPDVLPVAAIPSGRQIDGIGSGISYMYNNQHKLNILTLYSTNKAERDRARVGQYRVNDKLFTLDETEGPSSGPTFSPNPQVQEVCQAVSGFIYVANAEPGKGEGEVEAAKIQAVLGPAWGSTARPLLVLSCVSRERPEAEGAASRGSLTRARCRTPSVEMAQRLQLPQLPNPWMVQDTVAESLSGLLDGISWLLRYSGLRI
ncbi:hypothetical protein CRUP_038677 [Coryphaenoides rupestris]|nr:hypothetical protein CRUP_038677 [Coryphaenoides rupestris]